MSHITIYLAGDSTVADYPPESLPMLGWGAKLIMFLQPSVRVINEAKNGRSSKSFIDEGRLAGILERIGEGDVLLVQFGHNDNKDDPSRHTSPWDTYQQYLKRYIIGARERGAYPVLISSMSRRHFDENGKLLDTHGDYPAAMKELALREQVPYIDLSGKSSAVLQTMGDEKSKEWFTYLRPNEHPNYPDGLEDNTHLNEQGAEAVARLVAEELNLLQSPLKELITV